MLTKYLNYSSWAAVYQNISFGFSFGLSWAQWFLLIGLMDYCDQIFLFFLIFPVILSLLQSVMILMTLLYLWHDCRDTFVGWVPCQDCLTSWCLTSPSVLTLGSCSAAVTRLRWEMKGRCSILKTQISWRDYVLNSLKSKKIRSFILAKHWIELSTSTTIVLTFGHERFNI